MNHKIVCGQIRPLESTRSLQVELSLRPGLGSGGVWGGGVVGKGMLAGL